MAARRPRLPPALGRVPERLGRRQLRPARQRGLPRSRSPRASRTRRARNPDGVRRRRSGASFGGVRARRSRRSSGRSVLGGAALHELGRAPHAPPRLPRRHGSSRPSRRWARARPASVCRCSSRSRTSPRRGRAKTSSRACCASCARSSSSRSSPGCSSSSRWRCPGTSRCTCATGRRSPTGSSSTTCSTAPSRHVHDTNEGDDTSFRFYVWQLGYALFPWTGLAPLGLLWWLRRGTPAETTTARTRPCCSCMWFVFAFALFSFMGTKFHHYIFPAVPPIAMLIGVVLDDMLGDRPARAARVAAASTSAGLVAGAALMVLGVARMLAGLVLRREAGRAPRRSVGIARSGVVLACVAARPIARRSSCAGAMRARAATRRGATRRRATPATAERRGAHTSRMLAARRAVAAALAARRRRARSHHQAARAPTSRAPSGCSQLFTYNYRRGVAGLARLLRGARGVHGDRRDRDLAGARGEGRAPARGRRDVRVRVRLGRSGASTSTCRRRRQHWGQHEVIAAYYADRASPDEQLVAYQMNWKGENFYTGNHVPAFVSTGATFTDLAQEAARRRA